jgi:hypothetical protein
MPTRISAANIQPGAITADRLAEGVGGGPKITNSQVTDSGYNILDDTAVGLSGGYLRITGTGFQSGCVAIVGNTPAAATSFISSSFLNVQVGAAPAGTYILYVVNPDGGVAIRVNAVTYSQIPVWITGSTLPEIGVDDQISIQLSAAGDSPVAYRLLAEFTLPPGLSLSSSGLLTGSVTGLENDTLYSFTVIAEDTENQDSPRTFSITVVVGDPFFNSTVLLLNGDGANSAQNNTFLDSSANNFTITRNGNPTQGTFSPFSAPDGRWGGYFDGTGDWLTVTDNAAFDLGSGAFTIEGWFNPSALLNASILDTRYGSVSPFPGYLISPRSDGTMQVASENTNLLIGTIATPLNQWSHFAVVRDGSSNLSLFINGVRDVTTSSSTVFNSAGNPIIGAKSLSTSGLVPINGYLSNLRIIKNSAVYDPTLSTLTVPAIPLTAISDTSLLTCQSNRFKDNSTNNFTLTPSGDVRVTSFAPFAPAGVYSAATNGGSGYFDGNTDYLTVTGGNGTNLAGVDWTIDAWFYCLSVPANGTAIIQSTTGTNNWIAYLSIGINTNLTINCNLNAAGYSTTQTATLNAWNHVALVRSSGTINLYLNGQATSISVASDIVNQNLNFWIGMVSNQPGGGSYIYYWNGFISGVRIVKGTAIYTSNFTPPTAPLTAISNTSLLCNFTNAAIIDYTAKNVLETVGNAQISTSVKKYGTGSLAFDGSGDYLWMNTSNLNLFSFGTGAFTIEMWVYANNVTGIKVLLDWRPQSGATTQPVIYIDGTSLVWGAGPGLTSTNAITASTWIHVAVTRISTTIRMWINGVQTASNSSDSTNYINTASGRPLVGADTGLAGNWMNGYIDDLRITKGIARYTANFTPPESALRLR